MVGLGVRIVHWVAVPDVDVEALRHVVPGTPDVMRDGEPIPLEERTERCCVDAFWMIGRQVVCDIHLKAALPLLGIESGYEGLLEEGQPWHERHRYPQEEAAQG